ncbi:MAG: hypothetical protein KAS32_13780 [Candidatus Peribacteraceae bacterium]|nr:hypothetical protein [Candidatus Peribacteraceae bacterium]
MAFVSVVGRCIGCGRPFSFHPNKVPSLTVKGIREPVCKACVDRANPIRKEKGLPPITYSEDAYSGADESEINWEG